MGFVHVFHGGKMKSIRETLKSIICGGTLVILAGCFQNKIKENAQEPGQRTPSSEYDSFDSPHENGLDVDPEKLKSIQLGREIWYKATAGNARFHEYTLAQRVAGYRIDWDMVLHADRRDNRFTTWGLINDPECCTPGKDCQNLVGRPGANPEVLNDPDLIQKTYGWDYCIGDEKMWSYIGHPEKNWHDADPACSVDMKHGFQTGNKQNPCDLEFGMSAGAVGFRKFPNPKFDEKKWIAYNKSKTNWAKFNSRLDDFSIEPPYRMGISCASCHVSFEPLAKVKDPNHPSWSEIRGDVGNQYIRISDIFSSGFPKSSLEHQFFTFARPGTVDTSGIPNDYVNNPGTINAVINLDKKPKFPQQVKNWFPADSCPDGAKDEECWCDKDEKTKAVKKCWQMDTRTVKNVLHILKGGEDSVGPAGAVQRVYINIGSCSEQCWLNHLTDLRSLGPNTRNFGQTPFDIGQCRRDCPNYRAVEDRVGDVAAFLFSRRPTDLSEALVNNQMLSSRRADEFQNFVEQKFQGKIERGAGVFKENCARCHSSVTDNDDFRATDKNGIRNNWMGNDELTSIADVQSYACRVSHSNHMKGHVWEQYANDTRRAQPDLNYNGVDFTGGRGYYRNISLLSVWAHAPFMHNNAVGPELCPKSEKYPTPKYVDDKWQPVACQAFDPSIEGRLALFENSMKDLLNANRKLKQSYVRQDIILPLAVTKGGKPLSIRIQSNTKVGFLNLNYVASLNLKSLLLDVVDGMQSGDLRKYYDKKYNPEISGEVVSTLKDIKNRTTTAMTSGQQYVDITKADLEVLRPLYANCVELYDNVGHPFGTNLTEEQKKDLITFMATL